MELCIAKGDVDVNASDSLEWMLYDCPKQLKREFLDILPELKEQPETSKLLVLQTWQLTANPMSGFHDEVEEEREMKANSFAIWALQLCNHLREKGLWADFLDPINGIPGIGSRGSLFIETDVGFPLLGYKIADVGCCKILLHPKHNSFALPATVLTTASKQQLLHVLEMMK